MKITNYCVFCNENYVSNNTKNFEKYITLFKDNDLINKKHIEYPCNICQTRIRMRNWLLLYHVILKKIIDKSNAMIFCPDGTTEMKKFLPQNTKYVTLYGNFGSNVITGVDMQNLNQFKKNSFTFIQAIGTLDFIPNLKLALQQVHNILKNGGYFCFYIEMGRLTNDKNKKYIAEKYELPKHNCWTVHNNINVKCISHLNLSVSYLKEIGNDIFSNTKIYKIRDSYDERSCPSLFFLLKK